MSGPLQGVRVLDVSRLLSGPFCTMLLADLGAEIVKVERPMKGDLARQLGAKVGDDSAYFISVNRGKKSITLDLFLEEGQRLFRELLPHFDVLVENFVPGTMERLGLDYSSIKQLNPGLVYASISGFGQDGPYAQRRALDIIVQAMGGMMSVTGELDGPPIRPGASLGDSVVGVFAALAIVTAMFQRQQDGQGRYIDISMLDCQITMMENAFARYFATGQVPDRLGSRHPAATPFQVFSANDGYFVVALLTNDESIWRRFCEAIGLMELGEDERFKDNYNRTQHHYALTPILQRAFEGESIAYWLDALSKAAIPCSSVNSIEQVAQDPQVQHREMLVTIPHKSAGDWQVANTPFKLSGSTTGPAGPSPGLGEQTDEVLRNQLDLSDEEIGRLRARGVI